MHRIHKIVDDQKHRHKEHHSKLYWFAIITYILSFVFIVVMIWLLINAINQLSEQTSLPSVKGFMKKPNTSATMSPDMTFQAIKKTYPKNIRWTISKNPMSFTYTTYDKNYNPKMQKLRGTEMVGSGVVDTAKN